MALSVIRLKALTRQAVSLMIVFSVLPAVSAEAGDFGVFGAYAGFDKQGDGYGFNLKGGFPLLEALELEVRGGYYDDIAKSNLPKVEMIPVELGLSLNLRSGLPIIPYVSGGAGYYFFDAARGSVEDSVGGYFGGGIEIPFTNHFAATVEFLYRYVHEAEYSLSPRNKFEDGAAANVGLSLIW